MASMTMTSSFIPTMSVTTTKSPSSSSRRSVVTAKAASSEKASLDLTTTTKAVAARRDLMFAGVAAVACSLAKLALADEEEPKRGSPEAKKKYAQVCVTMPTARICRY